MSMPAEDRDVLFKNFARAFFKKDVDALYETVTEDFVWASLDAAGGAGAALTSGETSAMKTHSAKLQLAWLLSSRRIRK